MEHTLFLQYRIECHRQTPQHLTLPPQTLDSGKTPLAVLNIPRAEFPLRTDNVFLLRESGLSQDYPVFRNELDLAALHRAGRLDLTLVDHNLLPRSGWGYQAVCLCGWFVCACVCGYMCRCVDVCRCV